MAAADKDTIYIDIDDEITGIIDKLRNSDSKVVALVLPKRAAVFQSIVNMKLLKRAADSEKKNLVLITSEAGLLPLAGVAGVHVAKTLTSKPEIPAAPDAFDDTEESVHEDDSTSEPDTDEEETPVDPKTPVGKLAGAAAAGAIAADGVETLVMDDDTAPEDKSDGPKSFEPPTKPKNKKLAIPNFERFRLLLIGGGLLLLLIIGGFIFASVALPKATITVKTDATTVNTSADINLSTTATKLDATNNTLPAKVVTQQKTYTQSATTTGQKNNGNKASGSVTMSAGQCGFNVPSDIPAGTGIKSSEGQTYITQSNASFVPVTHGGHCTFQSGSAVTIIAQSGGTSFNGATTFSIPGSGVTATASSSISGGTDNIVKSVNQNDINSAKAKIDTTDPTVKSALQSQLQQAGYYPIDATFTAGTPVVTTSANVGAVADSVTVTETVTYSLFGVHKDDLNTVINNNIDGQIDSSKQAILDNGLSAAVFNVNNLTATTAQLSMSTKATAGPDIDAAGIKQMAAGKKPGAIKSELGDNPDVTSVSVKLSPFWISTVPKKTDRITVVIAKPSATAKASSNGANP